MSARVPMTVAVCVSLIASASSAEARPLKSVCDATEPFRRLSDLKYVKPVVRVRPESNAVKPTDVAFTIASKSGPITFKPNADGSIEFPLTDALCAENPEMTSNQPDGSVGFAVSIDPRLPPAKSLDYRQLEALRHEWDVAVSRQNLMWRVLAPSAKGFVFDFEAGRAASAEIRLVQGVRKLEADAKGRIEIPFEPAWAAANPAIVLSEMPRRIGLRF